MNQLLQNLNNGSLRVACVPAPRARNGSVVIRTACSLVSAGTERMLLDFGRAGWLKKARLQPEKLRIAFNKARAEGIFSTWQSIRSKLELPIPIGYCNVGTIVSSDSVKGFFPGQRVVSNGPHAEVICVSGQLIAAIPPSVSNASACFTPLAAIAWEGIDLLQVRPGDHVVVSGLGLIGQIAVRILLALGCKVLGLDPVKDRVATARAFGADVAPENIDPVEATLAWSCGKGANGVLITASTSSNEVISQSARSCAYRGKVVLVGVVGLNLNRSDFYANEVSFQVSCSYGRRDHSDRGSAVGNFRQVLEMMANGSLPLEDLISHRFRFIQASSAYEVLQSGRGLGIMLEYKNDDKIGNTDNIFDRHVIIQSKKEANGGPKFAVLGAGNFATRTFLPTLRRQGVILHAVVSNQGAAALIAGEKYGAAWVGTDEHRLWADSDLDAVVVSTRHDAHARQAISALVCGKHVWVEKPLAIDMGELDRIRSAFYARGATRNGKLPILMVGFNRRFSPIAKSLAEAIRPRLGPVTVEIKVNAGRQAGDNWTLNRAIGGGRIVGECCHFVDVARYFVGSSIRQARCLRRDASGQDGGTFELSFCDGSLARIDYRTDLPPNIPKEIIEVRGVGFSAKIHNWARLRSRGLGGLWKGHLWSRAPRKGHDEALAAFVNAIRGGSVPIAIDEIMDVSAWSIRLQGMSEGDSVVADSW